jgi:sorting and assembly machinery component 37
LYLYVSSNNYWNTISPAFTRILPWYSNYITPPLRRAAAIARTKHLGIRSLDLDSIDEYAAGDDARSVGQPTTASSFTGPANPEQLIKKQQSARWLRSQQHSDTFQLYHLTKSFFTPLEELLGDKRYLLSNDEPSSVDCLAVGYLSLMRYASVPQPWLADALRTRFPKLHAYTERMYSSTFKSKDRPWRSRTSEPAPPTASHAASSLARSALEWALPSVRQTIISDSSTDSSSYQKPDLLGKSFFSSLMAPTILLPVGAIAGIAVGIAKYLSISDLPDGGGKHTFQASEHDFLTPTKLNDLGESGAILSALGQQLDYKTQSAREKERTGGATLVEVDVENEKGEVGRDVIFKK